MEHFGKPLLVVQTRLLLKGALPTNDLLDLVEKHPILPLDLSIAILF